MWPQKHKCRAQMRKSTHMKRPVIVYFGPFALPDRNAAAHRAIGNAKVLQMLECDVRIVGFDESSDRRAKRGGRCVPGIGLVTIGAQSKSAPVISSFRLNPTSAIRYLLKLRRRRTIAGVICYNYPSLAQAGIQLFCKLRAIPYITDVTEWNTASGRSWLYDILRFADIDMRVRVLNKFADRLITTSPFMSTYYRRRNRRIAELPTLFDRSVIKFVEHKPRQAGNGVRLLFVGPGFDLALPKVEKKFLKERIDLVIQMTAAARNVGHDISIDIFGIAREQYIHFFPQDKGNLDKHAVAFRFHGRVPHAAILRALCEADFSIVLRDNKKGNNAGFPTKFAESLMCGTPVVIDEIESISAYFNHPHVLLLNRAEPSVMARQLLVLIEAYRNREWAQQSGRDSYQTFHFANFREEMAKVIDL